MGTFSLLMIGAIVLGMRCSVAVGRRSQDVGVDVRQDVGEGGWGALSCRAVRDDAAAATAPSNLRCNVKKIAM